MIYLQPVNPAKEGQVSAVKQSRWTFSPSSIIVGLCTLLGLGILGFVLFTIKSNGNSGPESTAVSTTMTTTTTTTTSAGSTTMAINTTTYTLETTTEVTMSTAATTISSRQMNNYSKRKDKQLRAIVLLSGAIANLSFPMKT